MVDAFVLPDSVLKEPISPSISIADAALEKMSEKNMYTGLDAMEELCSLGRPPKSIIFCCRTLLMLNNEFAAALNMNVDELWTAGKLLLNRIKEQPALIKNASFTPRMERTILELLEHPADAKGLTVWDCRKGSTAGAALMLLVRSKMPRALQAVTLILAVLYRSIQNTARSEIAEQVADALLLEGSSVAAVLFMPVPVTAICAQFPELLIVLLKRGAKMGTPEPRADGLVDIIVEFHSGMLRSLSVGVDAIESLSIMLLELAGPDYSPRRWELLEDRFVQRAIDLMRACSWRLFYLELVMFAGLLGAFVLTFIGQYSGGRTVVLSLVVMNVVIFEIGDVIGRCKSPSACMALDGRAAFCLQSVVRSTIVVANRYLFSGDGLLNMLMYGSVLVAVCTTAGSDVQVACASVAVVPLAMHLVRLLTMISFNFATFINMIEAMMLDIRQFFSVFIIFWLAFALSFHILLGSQEGGMLPMDGWATLQESLITLYLMALGNFDFDYEEVASRSPHLQIVFWVIFFVFTVVVLLLMMNMLIAMMATSYENELDPRKAHMQRARGTLRIYQLFCLLPSSFSFCRGSDDYELLVDYGDEVNAWGTPTSYTERSEGVDSSVSDDDFVMKRTLLKELQSIKNDVRLLAMKQKATIG